MYTRYKNTRWITSLIVLSLIFFGVATILHSPEDGDRVSDTEIADPVMREVSGENISVAANVSLNELIAPLQDFGPVNSLLISHKGELIAEEYFLRMYPGATNNIKSASKSILSILAGIAIDKGYLEGTDQTIEEFFPEYFARYPDSDKASITIGNLLTMRSGLASTSGGSYGRWVISNNWVQFALDRPLVGEPGEDRIYSTGNTHLLGYILSKASGMSLRAFADRYLFDPLDIRVGGWDRDPQGYYMGGNNMALRPADMIKIGQLMMDVGVYDGERIVSEDWVLRSVQPYTGRGRTNDYGYLWFRRMSGDYHVIYAWGNGGQYIKIIPELDAVIAITSQELSGATRRYRYELFESIDRDIVPYLASLQ